MLLTISSCVKSEKKKRKRKDEYLTKLSQASVLSWHRFNPRGPYKAKESFRNKGDFIMLIYQ